jgi:hypothetical protein
MFILSSLFADKRQRPCRSGSSLEAGRWHCKGGRTGCCIIVHSTRRRASARHSRNTDNRPSPITSWQSRIPEVCYGRIPARSDYHRRRRVRVWCMCTRVHCLAADRAVWWFRFGTASKACGASTSFCSAPKASTFFAKLSKQNLSAVSSVRPVRPRSTVFLKSAANRPNLHLDC